MTQQWQFTVVLQGEGDSQADAWEDATGAFALDPGKGLDYSPELLEDTEVQWQFTALDRGGKQELWSGFPSEEAALKSQRHLRGKGCHTFSKPMEIAKAVIDG